MIKISDKIKIYDTTLRDGTQGEDVSLSSNEKTRLALEIDKVGFDYIEGGWPGSNKKDIEFFENIKNLKLKNSRISAFSMTRRKDMKVEEDPNIQQLLNSETKVVTIVGKCWDLHLHRGDEFCLQDRRTEFIGYYLRCFSHASHFGGDPAGCGLGPDIRGNRCVAVWILWIILPGYFQTSWI